MNTVGVIVGRFQTPYLHLGHRSLIESVLSRHEETMIVLGCSAAQLTSDNPLDADTRRLMIHSAYPNVSVHTLYDAPSDEVWSEELDKLIDRRYPQHTPILYGNRDSFLSSYHGRYEYRKLPETVVTSATELRDAIVEPLPSADFRAGMIWASRLRYPAVFPTVDVALIDQGRILLGRKEKDGKLWRFPGGFVDPKDATLLEAAKRELFEECGMLEVHDFQYVGTKRINDYRYPEGAEDAIMTSLFMARYLWGNPKASDDLDEIAWHTLSPALLNLDMVPQHVELLPMLWDHLKKEKK